MKPPVAAVAGNMHMKRSSLPQTVSYLATPEGELQSASEAIHRRGHFDQTDMLVAALRGIGSEVASSFLGPAKHHSYAGEGKKKTTGSVVLSQHSDSIGHQEIVPFELLFEAAAVPILYKNLQGVQLGCNRAFENFFGLTKEQIVGKTIFDIASNDVAEQVAALDQLLVKNGGFQRYEGRIMNADGAFRDVLISKAIVKNDCAEAAGMITVMVDVTERKQAEHSLKEALEFAEGIITAIPDILFEADMEGRYLKVWAKDPNLLAQQKALLLGKTVNDVLPADQAAIALEALREADLTGASYGKCLRIPLPNGEIRWFELSVARKPGAEPSAGTFLVLSRDITERRQVEDAFGETRAHLISMLQTIPDMVWLKDGAGKYLLCNHAFARLVGKADVDIVGKTDCDLFNAELAQFLMDKDERTIDAECIHLSEEWVTSHETGQPMLLETRKVPIFGIGGEVAGMLGVARDITELNASRQKIHQLAFYDSLTSLPNRALFHERLQQMITDAETHDYVAGLMLIDIDHFKAVNDTMGHPVGDELLRMAGARLSKNVRKNDTVARLGGDEFAVLLPKVKHRDDLSRIANRILEAFKERFPLDGRELFISCSIGIALYSDDSSSANDLVKYADTALYLAKRSGRSNFRFYSKELTARAEERQRLESELRHAIEREELELHYQPKVLLGCGTMIGSEALLRWRHPQMGMVPPSQFIGIAEETGLIIDLGRWVLREACQTAAELNREGAPLHKVAINLSAKDFQCENLLDTVATILEQAQCRPEWIEIEITESLLLDDKSFTLETLSALQAMGMTIAIDDFGTGYSALSYLARFPIDTLKIDRSFISSADGRNSELVKAILSIAHCLGQNVVAEGVETIEQASFLAAIGCPAAQGFLYSKPLPKAEILSISRHLNPVK